MFHSHGGWFFKRDGADVVILRSSGMAADVPQEVVRFTPFEWASIVSSLSQQGETSESWRQALFFHDTASAKPYTVWR